MIFSKDLNWDAVKKKITESKIGDALSSVKFGVTQSLLLFLATLVALHFTPVSKSVSR